MPTRKPDDVIVTELQAEVDALKRQLEEARADVIHWQTRYERAINPIYEQETRAQIRFQVLMNQAMVQHAQAQINAQQAMNAQNFYAGDGFQQGILGSLNPFSQAQQHAFGVCNCVPGRQGFLTGGQA